MNWKIKARIQSVIAKLPSRLSYNFYYYIQRKFGRLKKFDVLPIFKGGYNIIDLINDAGYSQRGKVFFEVGTGRAPIIPMVYWLMGAKKTITVDLNPYMEKEIIIQVLQYILENQEKVEALFDKYLDRKRFSQLIIFSQKNSFMVSDYLKLCHIQYMSPADATNMDIESNSIDFHTSFTVFEHIPSSIILNILSEGKRIVKPNGLFINIIDYFDHFMHFDKKISSINFLQYSDLIWSKYADNKFMYMNRLRHDDFIEIFKSSHHQILIENYTIDKNALELLNSGNFNLDGRFSGKSNEVNCIDSSAIVSKVAT